MWRLVHAGGALDENSPYAYVLVCTHWAATSAVATSGDGELAGFMAGHRVPDDPDTLFVWQIAVTPDHRGQGLASRLLDAVIARTPQPRWLEATVTPSNKASDALFRGAAHRWSTDISVRDWAPASWFPGDHEPERRYRIGPIRSPGST